MKLIIDSTLLEIHKHHQQEIHEHHLAQSLKTWIAQPYNMIEIEKV